MSDRFLRQSYDSDLGKAATQAGPGTAESERRAAAESARAPIHQNSRLREGAMAPEIWISVILLGLTLIVVSILLSGP